MQTLLFHEFWADPAGHPAALRVEPALPDDAAPDTAALAALAARFPVFSGHPAVQAAAGVQPAPQTGVMRLGEGLPIRGTTAGARWLCGDWYMQPPVRAGGASAVSRGLAMQLVQLVAADADTRELEDVFRRDPNLSYQLLRLVNSLAFGSSKKISSFSQAILLLGRAQLRRWLNLMLFAAGKDDPRSPMLLARVLVRARRCELLAHAVGLDRAAQEQAFMAGMFSLLGVLFGQPLPEVLTPLKLNAVLQAALLQREGELGELLHLAESLEPCDASRLPEVLPAGLTVTRLAALEHEVWAWAVDAVRQMQETQHA